MKVKFSWRRIWPFLRALSGDTSFQIVTVPCTLSCITLASIGGADNWRAFWWTFGFGVIVVVIVTARFIKERRNRRLALAGGKAANFSNVGAVVLCASTYGSQIRLGVPGLGRSTLELECDVAWVTSLCGRILKQSGVKKIALVKTESSDSMAPDIVAWCGQLGVVVEQFTISVHDEAEVDGIRDMFAQAIAWARSQTKLRIVVDATGGTKPMSLGAFAAGIDAGLEVVYQHTPAGAETVIKTILERDNERLEAFEAEIERTAQ